MARKYDPAITEDITFSIEGAAYIVRHTGGVVERIWSADYAEQQLSWIPNVVKAFTEKASEPSFAKIPRWFKNPLMLDDDGRPL